MFADFGSAAARVSDGDGAAEADAGGGGGVQADVAQDAQKGAHGARPGDDGARHFETGTDHLRRFTLSKSKYKVVQLDLIPEVEVVTYVVG